VFLTTRVSKIDRGWISLESVVFSEPVEDGAALIGRACDLALDRLHPQQRRDLETLLALGDFEIPTGSLRVTRRATPEELADDLATQVARLVGDELGAYCLPKRIAEAAALLQTQSKGFLGRIKSFFKRKKVGFDLGEVGRQAAEDAGREMRKVISDALDPNANEGQITRERAIHIDKAIQAFAHTKGIEFENFEITHGTLKMVMGGAIPSVTPDEDDFTKLSYGHSEKYAEAVRHEVVHVMHCTQARHTAMEQVCAARGVDSIHELPVEGLAEIQARINEFESGSNYPRLEVLAVAIGGTGGKKELTEAEFRARMLQGSEEVEAAFQTDDLAINVDAGFLDRLGGQFGARIGSTTLQGLMNMMSIVVPFIINPWMVIPGVVWTILRQPEVRQLLGKLLSEAE
jgi:hypothetical protein